MKREELEEKKRISTHNCDTCEFKVVPVKIEPCRSCNETTDNWTRNPVLRTETKDDRY